MRPLNFASQPFRNERLPALVFTVAAVLLVGLTIRHAFLLRALLPARTSKLHREVSALETELDRLRTEGRSLTAPKPDKQAVAEWNVLKDLVDRRTFSWTGLFARLEKVLPREVKLVSIAPYVKDGQVVLDIVAVAKPAQAGLGLVGLLEQREEFEDVYPMRVTEKEGGEAEFNYTMRYLPVATMEAAATDAPAEGADAGEAADAEAEPAAQPATLQSKTPAPAAAAAPPPSTPPAAKTPGVPPPQKQARPAPPPGDVPSERNPTPPPAKPDSDTSDTRSPSRKPERNH